MKFLNEYYTKSGKTKFLSQAAILAFISDVVNICYINFYFLPQKVTLNSLMKTYSLMGADPRMFHPTYLQELRQVMINSVSFIFIGFLFYHILVYFKLSRDSRWAKKYMSFYAITGAILTASELPGLAREHIGWALVTFATMLIYIFVFLGLRFFKKTKAR